MKNYKEKYMIRLSLLLVIILGGFLTVAGIGETYARYETSLQEKLTFEYKGDTGAVYLRSSEKDEDGAYVTDENGYLGKLSGWEQTVDETGAVVENSYTLSFLVTNGKSTKAPSDMDQRAGLSLFATVGILDPEELTIVLTDGQNSYTAVPTAIEKGMMWYEMYGPGWMYQFSNAAGEELTWPLPGGMFACREMTLTVIGQSEKVAALQLIASVWPGLIEE